MIDFKGKKVAILGWGVDTQDVEPWLREKGATVTILDEARGDKFENLDNYDLIIRSPGVYRYREELVKTKTVVTSKTKLFFDNCPAKIIGVTGTKGKGTTATLIYEILKAAGKDVYLGGNIGAGVFDLKLRPEAFVILELSSFQLIDLHKSPHIAVILMVTSEHMNWHKNLEEYVTAKGQMVLHQSDGDFVVANRDYPSSKKIAKMSDGMIVWVSGKDMNLPTHLRGEHNKENISAAIAVAKIIGVPYEETIKNFGGLEHRLEEVSTVNGVTFYNDSFSTTPETAIAAVKSFAEPEVVILGGSSKESDFSELVKVIESAKNIKKIILMGLEGKRLAGMIKKTTVITGLKTMEEIVKTAYNIAKSGDVVLLSPACASFDMFKNYKDRGLQFKRAVLALNEKQSP